MNEWFDFYFSNISATLNQAWHSPESIHPLIVHFPIALLYVAPLFILVGACFKDIRRPFFWSSCLLLMLGTFSLWLALITGEMSVESMTMTPPEESIEAISYHDELAHVSRNFFIVLTVIFLLYVSNFRKLFFQLRRRWHNLFLAAYLTAYIAGLVVLTNTAHYGAELVHQHHITSGLFSDENH